MRREYLAGPGCLTGMDAMMVLDVRELRPQVFGGERAHTFRASVVAKNFLAITHFSSVKLPIYYMSDGPAVRDMNMMYKNVFGGLS